MLLFKTILIAILLLYVLICALAFVLRALINGSSSQTPSADGYKTIYSALLDGNNFSNKKYKAYSNPLPDVYGQKPNGILKFERGLISVLVPASTRIKPERRICFLLAKALNNLFSSGSSFYFPGFSVNNRITRFLKSIKVVN